MLAPMDGMLAHAHENRYAVMAVNCCNLETAEAVIGAAGKECAPVIINLSPRQLRLHADIDAVVPMIAGIAEKTTVPVCINLDHGMEYADIVSALDAGFTNIMFDGSSLPFEQNLATTRLVVTMAHAQGASVEAELGHVGQAADGDGERQDFFTNVDKAVEFVAKTGVDALAVAIGTAHGKYPEGFVPKLDFDRLHELDEALDMPLVLHGGSGAGEENIRRCVEGGINKINVCTDLFAVGRDSLLDTLQKDPRTDWLGVMMRAQEVMEEWLRAYMRMIGCSGRCAYDLAAMRECD